MEEQKVRTLSQYLNLLNFHKPFLYRGASDVEKHQLIPLVGRNWLSGLDELVQTEKEMLENLKSRAAILLDHQPENDWEWLIIGQHYGMPTRLLDWTANPLVALYFACAKDMDRDGAIYLSDGLEKLDPEENPDFTNIQKDFYLAPRHISPRIAAQSAFFIVSSDPTKPLEVTHEFHDINTGKDSTSDLRIIIPEFIKFFMLHDLRRLGIGPASLFPGLGGLCEQIAMEDYYQREEKNRIIRYKKMEEEIIKNQAKKK